MIRSFVYRAFVSCIVRFSYRSCEAFVHFSFVSFAFFVRLRLVRIVNLYDPGSVSYPIYAMCPETAFIFLITRCAADGSHLDDNMHPGKDIIFHLTPFLLDCHHFYHRLARCAQGPF